VTREDLEGYIGTKGVSITTIARADGLPPTPHAAH
jgi:hypothetical protein